MRIIFLVLLSAVCAFGQAQFGSASLGSYSTGAAIPGVPPASYLFDENFEETLDGWTVVGSARLVNHHQAQQGSQCVRLESPSSDCTITCTNFTDVTTCYVYWKTYITNYPATPGRTLFAIRRNTTSLESILISPAGKVSVSGGSVTTDSVPIDTWVHFWVSYNASTGAATVAFSQTEPGRQPGQHTRI